MSKITVVRASTSTPTGKNYQVCELAYKTDEGKTKGMKLFGFGAQKGNFEVASKSNTGDILEASFQQNDKGYWEFGSLKSTGEVVVPATITGPAGSGNSTSSVGSTKGNWETSEERVDRQAKISKQAVLNTSVAYFEAAKVKPSPEDVVKVAQQFLDFVNNKPVSQDVQ